MKIKTLDKCNLIKNNTFKFLFRIMRLSFTLLFVFSFHLIALNSNSQSAIIKLKTNSITMGQLISEIEKQTDYLVIYSNCEVNSKRKVQLSQKSDKVSTYLDEALSGTNIGYDFENNYIVLAKKENLNTETVAQLIYKKQQEKKQIHGKVLDNNGETIIGANVIEVGTLNGTITDIDGNFTLSVSNGASIRVSYIGYLDKEIKTGGQTSFEIVLMEDTKMLDEVVVVGYGTLRKSDLTGAISSVDVEELGKRTTTNPAEALQGKVAGVNIQKFGGNAGSGVQIKIRGVKTFGNNNPLYVIDGFPSDINNVNPQDIKSMEILKDGAAAAIYGSVAANGVVLITTKSGQKGDIKVELNSYLSVVDVAKKLELLNGQEYRQVHTQMYENWNMYAEDKDKVILPTYLINKSDISTDWQEAMLRKGLAQNYMISVRGGADKSNYSISYNHTEEKGIFLGNNYSHDNARAKLNLKKSIIDFDANISFKHTNSKQPLYSLKEMYMISPLVPIYDTKQISGFGLTNFDGIPNNRNVMADYHFKSSYNKKYHTAANIAITLNFTDWLNFRSGYSYRGEHERSMEHAPIYVADIRSKKEYPEHSEYSGYWQEQVFDNILNFNKQIDSHSINAMLGTSITKEQMTWNSVAVEGKTILYKVEDGKLVTDEIAAGFLDPYFSTIGAGAGGTFSGDGTKWDYRRASFFGRLNYNYANTYLFQATLRRDGSSKFGADSRWGLFPSIALGWRVSEESFFPKDRIFSNIKLRASWGRLGNENALGKYDFLALISMVNNKSQGYVKGNGENAWAGSIARTLENKSLKWETTDNKNIGIDFGLLRNKLSGSVNYYYNETVDLLITKALPPSAGLKDPTLNVGKMRNNGLEIELNWSDKYKQMNYNIGFNLSTIHNKVIALADANQVLYGEGLKYGSEHFPTQTRVGMPIGAFYLYRTDGIFQNEQEVMAHKNKEGILLQPKARPGDIRFIDLDGNGVIDEEDKDFVGSGIPKLEANISLSMDYKGFDCTMLLSGAWGHKLYNGNKYFYEGMNSGSNFLKSTLNAWTPQNKSTNVPRAIYQDPNGNLRESDRFLEKGDFIRLRQLQFGYSLPKKIIQKINIDKLRCYISAENLLTITSYTGIDPEFSRLSVLNTGIDKLIYPFTRSGTIGLQLTF